MPVPGYYWRAEWHGFGGQPPQIAQQCLKRVRSPQYVCFTILLLLKGCDMQLYVWHGWHIQHKPQLDVVYIHIKCQETACEMFALNWRWGVCMCGCLVCVNVFAFSLALHKKSNNNFMTKLLFLILVLSNVERHHEGEARKWAQTGHILCWQCDYKVSFKNGGAMKGSLLAPVSDLTIAVMCRGCIANSLHSNGRKRAEAGSGMRLPMEGSVIFYLSEHSGLEVTPCD